MKSLFAVSAPRRGRDGNSHPSGRAKARSLNQGQPGGIPGVYRVGQSAAFLLPEGRVEGLSNVGVNTGVRDGQDHRTSLLLLAGQWPSDPQASNGGGF